MFPCHQLELREGCFRRAVFPLRSVVLFGGFALFAVVEIVSAVARGKGPPTKPAPRYTMDIAAVIGGFVVAGLLAVFHGVLFGVPVM